MALVYITTPSYIAILWTTKIGQFLLVAAGMALPAFAGEFNKKVSIGDAIPDFSKLEGTDDKSHSLGDFKDKAPATVSVAFQVSGNWSS